MVGARWLIVVDDKVVATKLWSWLLWETIPHLGTSAIVALSFICISYLHRYIYIYTCVYVYQSLSLSTSINYEHGLGSRFKDMFQKIEQFTVHLVESNMTLDHEETIVNMPWSSAAASFHEPTTIKCLGRQPLLNRSPLTLINQDMTKG